MKSNTIKRFGVAAGIFIGLVVVAMLVSYKYLLRVAMEIADRNPTTALHSVQDFAWGLPLHSRPRRERLNLGCQGSAVQTASP
jgi:hypothetical protein